MKIIQWSGDCRVFKRALAYAKDFGIENINGGDSRFDSTYPSYAWIRPLCITQEGLIQPYASMSNENTYTNLWSDKFYAFNELIKTLEATEAPIRLRPINLYYHMYSGEKTASISALKENISFIRSKSMIPIRASHFSGMIQDFYRLEIKIVNQEEFVLINRGRLQTIRFDKAVDKGVDFLRSKGIIGERHYAGSLYVYLDEVVPDTKIVLKPIEQFDREPLEKEFYLIESSYIVKDLQREEGTYQFDIDGFGELLMRWSIPQPGRFAVTLTEDGKIREEIQIVSKENELVVQRPHQPHGKTRVKITRI